MSSDCFWCSCSGSESESPVLRTGVIWKSGWRWWCWVSSRSGWLLELLTELTNCLQLISLSNTKLCFPKRRDPRGAYWNINDQNKKNIFNFQKERNLWGGSDRWMKRAWLDRQTSNWGEEPFLPLRAVGIFVSQALFFFFNKSTWNSLKSRALV